MSNTNPIVSEPDEPVTTKRSSYRRAIIVSVIIHVLLLIVLASWYLPNTSQSESTAAVAEPVESVGTANHEARRAPSPPPDAAIDVPADEIKKSVLSQIEQVSKLPDERKLSELEKNLKRLERVADQDSVKEVTSTIASSLGLDEQQYAPKPAPVEGDFDTDSAQLEDVIRTRSESGQWEYESVLVDANGRSKTVPMSQAEGEPIYNAFEQMQKFPLAEGIYRGVVMPLIQKMLKAEEATKKAVIEAEKIKRNDESVIASELLETSE